MIKEEITWKKDRTNISYIGSNIGVMMGYTQYIPKQNHGRFYTMSNCVKSARVIMLNQIILKNKI